MATSRQLTARRNEKDAEKKKVIAAWVANPFK